jgi:hypothetical protein
LYRDLTLMIEPGGIEMIGELQAEQSQTSGILMQFPVETDPRYAGSHDAESAAILFPSVLPPGCSVSVQRRWFARVLHGLMWCVTAACFALAILGPEPFTSSTTSDSEASVPNGRGESQSQFVTASPVLVTRPIEMLRPGMRVVAENPEELPGQKDTLVTPEFWRLVRLRMVKSDGHRLDIELLRPVGWLVEELIRIAQETPGDQFLKSTSVMADESNHVLPRREDILSQLCVGQTISMDLPEMGAEGPAEIVAVEPCPTLEQGGRGRRLVTGTFRHEASNVLDLRVEGEQLSLGVTGTHPFWSVTQERFVAAAELRVGEELLRADGRPAKLLSKSQRAGSNVPVFNIEVDVEHVYLVGHSGLLVHNQYHHIVSIYDNAKRPDTAVFITKSREILENASIKLGDKTANVLFVPHHLPKRHSDAYHKAVSDTLKSYVRNLQPNTPAYSAAVRAALDDLYARIMNHSLPLY